MIDVESDWSHYDFVWGVKDSFIDYIRSLPDGVILPFGGAGEFPAGAGGEWVFPYARQEIEKSVTKVEFDGELRMRAHNGMLLVIFMNPCLSFFENETTLTVVDLMVWPDTTKRQLVGRGPSVTIPGSGEPMVLSMALAAEGVELFGGVYGSGTDLAPVKLVER